MRTKKLGAALVVLTLGVTALPVTAEALGGTPGGCPARQAPALAFAAKEVQVPIGGASVAGPTLTATCEGAPAPQPYIELKITSLNDNASFVGQSAVNIAGDTVGDIALPLITSGLQPGAFTVEADFSGVTTTLAGTVVGTLSGITPPQVPPSNTGHPPLVTFPAGTGIPAGTYCLEPAGTTCYIGPAGWINTGRRTENLGPLLLPSNWEMLTVPQQLFVLTNLERTTRGLPTITGMASDLDTVAQTGAENWTDPLAPGWGVWDGGGALSSSAEAVALWMYLDGPGGVNLDCPPSGGGGCWGHRHALLYDEPMMTCGLSCAMGAGYTTAHNESSYTEALVAGQEPPDPLIFTWAQEVDYLPSCEQSGDTCSWASAPQMIAVPIPQPSSPSGAITPESRPRADTTTGHATASTRLILLLHSASVKGAIALVKLTCAGPTACHGSLRLTALVKVKRKHGATFHYVPIGNASFSIGKHRSATLHIQLSSNGRALLRKAPRRSLTAKLEGAGMENSMLLLIEAPQPRKQRAH